MTTITFQNGNVVFRDGKVGSGSECCCSQSVCCGIPKNCTVTVSASDDYVYDQASNTWKDGNGNVWGISFGDCTNASANLGNEYLTCCIWYSNGGSPGGDCIIFGASLIGRVVCDSCCDSDPDYAGDANEYGVNCRIEGVVKSFTQVGDCSAQKAAIDFDNWDITISCGPPPDPCNPFP